MAKVRRKKIPSAKPAREPLPRAYRAPLCPAFARVIREQRLRRGWSKNQLARNAGLSEAMVRYVESLSRTPTLDTVARLSHALGLSASALVVNAERALF